MSENIEFKAGDIVEAFESKGLHVVEDSAVSATYPLLVDGKTYTRDGKLNARIKKVSLRLVTVKNLQIVNDDMKLTNDELEHLWWMLERLVKVHKENRQVDYMKKFGHILNKIQYNITVPSTSAEASTLKKRVAFLERECCYAIVASGADVKAIASQTQNLMDGVPNYVVKAVTNEQT